MHSMLFLITRAPNRGRQKGYIFVYYIILNMKIRFNTFLMCPPIQTVVVERWFVFRPSEYKTHTYSVMGGGRENQNKTTAEKLYQFLPALRGANPIPRGLHGDCGARHGHTLYASRGSDARVWLPHRQPLGSRRTLNIGYARPSRSLDIRDRRRHVCRWSTVSVSLRYVFRFFFFP
jgi:hypothetical protein